MYEERIVILERDLEVLSVAQAQLDEQKQQNLFLKEIIDRVRYEIDEMRNAASGNFTGVVCQVLRIVLARALVLSLWER